MKTQSFFETIISKFFVYNKASIILFFLLSLLSLYYTYTNINIVTDTDKLINNELDFKKQQKRFKENFPTVSNNILIFLESNNKKILYQEGEKIKKHLLKMNDKIDFFFSPNTEEFYQKHSLKIMNNELREEILNKLFIYQPFLSEISNNPKMKGVNNLLDLTISRYNKDKNLDDFSNINFLLSEFYYTLKEKKILDWNQVFIEGNYEYYLILKINEEYLKQNGFGDFYNFLSELKRNKQNDIELSFTGGRVIDYEETQSVIKNSSKAGLLSLFVVALILWFAFKNFFITFSLIISILIGLSITLGLTTLLVGSLNIISIAFAVLFIGISVDFGIQYCSRMLESGTIEMDTMQNSIFSILSSLIIVSITSIVGFLSFIPTDYVGLSELGIISSIGMFVGLIVNIIFLPSLLRCFLKFIKCRNPTEYYLKNLIDMFSTKKTIIYYLMTFIVLFGILSLTKIKFDSDPMKLKDQNSQSVKLAYKLMEKNPSSDYTISIIKNELINEKEILDLQENEVVKEVNYINKLKLEPELIETIDYLTFLLTPKQDTLFSSQSELVTFMDNLKKIKNLKIDESSKFADKILILLNKKEYSFEELQFFLFSDFNNLMSEILMLLNSSEVRMEEIPDFYLNRFESQNGLKRYEVFPSKDMSNLENLNEFVNFVQNKFPNSTGMPIVQLEAGRIVISSFKFALTFSLSFLVLFIFLIFRDVKTIFYCIFPLFFSIFFISIIMKLINLNLNFANMIALPLLFSLGSSYSIYIIKRIKDFGDVNKMLHSSTPSAIFFSSFTTIGAFGTFAISTHYGTASMGILLFISLIIAQLTCLILLPFIIKEFKLSV